MLRVEDEVNLKSKEITTIIEQYLELSAMQIEIEEYKSPSLI